MSFWNKKIRKILDIGVLCAIGVGVLAIGGGTVLGDFAGYQQYSAEYDAQQKAAMDALRDETGHIPGPLPGVDPTETSVGYTAGKKCVECGEIYEGHVEIPRLCEDYYTYTSIRTKASVTIKWTLKPEIAESTGLGSRTYSTIYTKGFIGVGGSNYTAFEFNKLYPGVEMTYDEEASMITLDVTKEGGYTFNQAISVGGVSALKLTGNPLNIVTTAGSDALNCESQTVDLIVENELDVHATNHLNTSTTASAIVARKISVGEYGVVRASNFKYAFYTRENVDLKGQLDASGTVSAFYSSTSTNDGKYVEFNAENNSVYLNDVKQTSLTSNQILLKNCKKHMIVCNADTQLKAFTYYVPTGTVTEPTETSVGSATFQCVGCGTDKITVELPKLGTEGYVESPTSVKVDGIPTQVMSYEYKLPGVNANSIIFDKRDSLKDYINAGGYYYTVSGWNNLFPNAQASVTDKVMTITLTGDQDVTTSTTTNKEFNGLLDLSCYKKVIVKGMGKSLSFAFTGTTGGLIVNDLEIQSGATVNITGKAKETGLTVRNGLTVSGNLNISNYITALDIKETEGSNPAPITINASGTVALSATTNGVYNSSPVAITNNGHLTITKAKYGMNMGEANSMNFAGNSETTITSGTNCIRGQYDDYIGDRLGTDTRKNPKIRIQDSAKFNATATSGAGILMYLQFIVENEGGTQCDAEVNITCAGGGSAVYGLRTGEDSSSGADYTKIFILNSSKEMNVLGTTTKTEKAQGGLYFRHNNVKIQIKTALHIGTFAYAIKHYNIKWSSGDIIYDNSTPMITFDNYNASENNFFQKEGEVSGYSIKSVIYKFKNSSGSVIDLSAI